jgi:predicted esterase
MNSNSSAIRNLLRRKLFCVSSLIVTLVALLPAAAARADKIVLQDGREYEGRLTRINAMLADPGQVKDDIKSIVMVNNDLTYTFVPQKFITKVEAAAANSRLEEIDVPQAIAVAGQRLGSVGPILEIDKFDPHGRRTFSMAGGPTGRIDVVQGITKITPVWCRVQGLQTSGVPAFIWDMRIATTSVPREILTQVIRRKIDPKNPDERLKIVRLYLQAERYFDAVAELDQIVSDFPGRAGLATVAHDLKQMGARQAIKEADTRRKAGQHGLAFSMLKTFPPKDVDGELLQQVRVKLEEYTELQKQGQGIVAQLSESLAKLPEGARKRAEAAVKEINEQLSINTLDRMATYRRFAEDPQSSVETKLALAISSWLVGAADATENLQLAMSMVELRNLTSAYLAEDVKLKRVELLAQIRSQEAASPKVIAAIIDNIKPPVETSPQELPGYYKLVVPGVPDEPPPNYYVQLPPEYDPHVKYPCIVSLHGSGSTAENQVAWWAGDFIERNGQKFRAGQAARHGYIVVAPNWTAPHQRQYEGSAREHDLVLSALRDACKRFSIDTDRLFLSGHSAGATAAWDIGLAHPDLWAGVIPIVPTVARSIERNWQNAERLPFYFVCGEMDGDKFIKNSPQFDIYFKQSEVGLFDCTVVQYQGRGHEHFSDEILRIFDWMGRKERNFSPREFTVNSHRAWDNYFWWVELRDFKPKPTGPALLLKSKLTASNGVMVSTGGKVTVWLSPSMVDFSRPVIVNLNAAAIQPPNKIAPSIEVILDDARGRADRQHPFWAKVE